MTFKRKVLAALTRSDLLEVGRALELDVTTNMWLDDLLDVVAGGKRRGIAVSARAVVNQGLHRDGEDAGCDFVARGVGAGS